jgi:hypothetical protein
MTEHPGEDALARLAEGEPDEATSDHVSACSACREQLALARRTAALLASYSPLSRNLCPPRAQLVERPNAFAAHTALCPLCREDLQDLAALEAPPRPSLVVAWAKGALELLESTFQGRLASPAPALARGGEAQASVFLRQPLAPAGALEVALAPGREGVDVLVRLEGATRFRVELVRAGKVLEGREAEEGRVLLDGVAPGAYELVLHRPGERAVDVRLEVRPR